MARRLTIQCFGTGFSLHFCHLFEDAHFSLFVVLVFVLLWGLGPYTLYYANIMLRIPPFVDDDDYDVITQIVVMSALRSFDKDGNKFLDADEVKAIVQKIEPGLADDEIDTLIRRADTDGDGHIDYEEFSTILLNKDAGDHERVQVTKVKRKIATHAKKDVRLGASADESKDSAH